ncbi:pirin family protein [Cohnella thermotolerans]|uniref:pirin family protein n=1 Tax=Cohnella thermotolerans TaxID=329858 RepID=UPI00041A94A7|nr:pirin family protein [Cohnella thermotolerans]
MIRIQKAEDRHHADHGWLKSSFSYSFADYYDPQYLQFGPMRVLNDDWIAPAAGFGMHPHREMEIVTLVLSGLLEHRDSLGNRAVTTWGEVQRMSAGTGVYHSEYNASETEPLKLLQMWFQPAERGLEPSYETTRFDPASLRGRWVPIASVSPEAGRVAHVHQDMTIYLTELEAGTRAEFRQEAGRRMFLFVVEGEIRLNGTESLGRRDAARIEGETELALESGSGATVMLIDLP